MRFIKFILILGVMGAVLYFVAVSGGNGGIEAQLMKLSQGEKAAETPVVDTEKTTKISVGEAEKTTVTTTADGIKIAVKNNLPECSDGVDNDGDEVYDFGYDKGCTSKEDNSEYTAQCSDGIDNDKNGVWDYPYDKTCSSPADEKEGE